MLLPAVELQLCRPVQHSNTVICLGRLPHTLELVKFATAKPVTSLPSKHVHFCRLCRQWARHGWKMLLKLAREAPCSSSSSMCSETELSQLHCYEVRLPFILLSCHAGHAHMPGIRAAVMLKRKHVNATSHVPLAAASENIVFCRYLCSAGAVCSIWSCGMASRHLAHAHMPYQWSSIALHSDCLWRKAQQAFVDP